MNIFEKMNDRILFCGQGAGVMAIECDTGIFQAFEESGIIPGKALTSSGSTLFSSLYYSGHPVRWFHDLMENRSLDEFFQFSIGGTIGSLFGGARHIVNNDGVKELLERYMTAKATLRVTTSVTKLSDWSAKFMSATPLTALAATSIPWVFKPVKIGDSLYVDGGVVNNIPLPKPEELDKWDHIYVFLAPKTVYNDKECDPLLIGLIELLQAIMDRELKQLEETGYFDNPKITVINPPDALGGGLLNWSPNFQLRDAVYKQTKELLQNA